jgi:hypothetical protein
MFMELFFFVLMNLRFQALKLKLPQNYASPKPFLDQLELLSCFLIAFSLVVGLEAFMFIKIRSVKNILS